MIGFIILIIMWRTINYFGVYINNSSNYFIMKHIWNFPNPVSVMLGVCTGPNDEPSVT